MSTIETPLKALSASENPPPPFIATVDTPDVTPPAEKGLTPQEVSYEQGFQVGLRLGQSQEWQRIQSIEAQSLPGHEGLIQRLKADGVSASDAALQVLAADKAQRLQMAAALEQDAPAALPPVLDSSLRAQASLPLEAQCEAEWQTSPGIREEFHSYEGYVAYRKAEARGCIKKFHRSEEAV